MVDFTDEDGTNGDTTHVRYLKLLSFQYVENGSKLTDFRRDPNAYGTVTRWRGKSIGLVGDQTFGVQFL